MCGWCRNNKVESGLKELYTELLKSSSTNLSKSDGLHFPSESVDGRAARDCLGKAVLYSDGVWEEGSLVDESSCKGYQEPHVISSH